MLASCFGEDGISEVPSITHPQADREESDRVSGSERDGRDEREETGENGVTSLKGKKSSVHLVCMTCLFRRRNLRCGL